MTQRIFDSKGITLGADGRVELTDQQLSAIEAETGNLKAGAIFGQDEDLGCLRLDNFNCDRLVNGACDNITTCKLGENTRQCSNLTSCEGARNAAPCRNPSRC